MPYVVIVDGGHLFAAAGRALGFGARRIPGRFNATALVDHLLELVPGGEASVRWHDGAFVDSPVPEHQVLAADPRVHLALWPLRGGQQRHVEAVVLHDVITLAQTGANLLLVGDPRRHAVALQLAEHQEAPVTLIGIADGEATPAKRMWLRRPELWRSLANFDPSRVRSSRPAPGSYVPPAALASPARIPRADS